MLSTLSHHVIQMYSETFFSNVHLQHFISIDGLHVVQQWKYEIEFFCWENNTFDSLIEFMFGPLLLITKSIRQINIQVTRCYNGNGIQISK